MVSYVEQATLRVVDEASSTIAAINQHLSSLFALAERGARVNIDVSRVSNTNRSLRAAVSHLERLRELSSQAFRIDTSSITRAANTTRRLSQQLAAASRESTRTASNINRMAAALGRDMPLVRVRDQVGAMRRLAREAERARAVDRIRIPVSLPGIGRAIFDLSELNAQLHRAGRVRGIGPRGGGGGYTPTERYYGIGPGGIDSAHLFDATIRRLAFSIEDAIIRGFDRGVSELSVANTRLELQNLTPAQMAFAERLTERMTERFPIFSRGEALGAVSEILPIVRQNEEAAIQLAQEIARYASLQTSLDMPREEAVSRAFMLARVGEQSGWFTAPDGSFDSAGMQQFFRTMYRAFIHIGREMNADLAAGVFRQLRGSRFSLDERGILVALLAAEEQGITAGTGVNQLIRSLSGERTTDRARQQLVELGLMQTREVQAGTVNGRVATRTVVSEVVDEELLRSNPVAWVVQHIIPAMRAAGLDPSNPVDASRFAGRLVGDRTAIAALVEYIVKGNSLLRDVELMMRYDVSPRAIDETINSSLLNAASQAKGQFVSMLGEVGHAFEGILIPALHNAAEAFSGMAEFIAGPDGQGSVVRATAVVAGGLAAPLLGTYAVLRIAFRGFARTIGNTIAEKMVAAGVGTRAVTAAAELAAAPLQAVANNTATIATAATQTASRTAATATAAEAAAAGAARAASQAAQSSGGIRMLLGRLLAGLASLPATAAMFALTPSELGDGTITREVFDLMNLSEEARAQYDQMVMDGATPEELRAFVASQPTSGQRMSGETSEEYRRLGELRQMLEENVAEQQRLSEQINMTELTQPARPEQEGRLERYVRPRTASEIFLNQNVSAASRTEWRLVDENGNPIPIDRLEELQRRQAENIRQADEFRREITNLLVDLISRGEISRGEFMDLAGPYRNIVANTRLDPDVIAMAFSRYPYNRRQPGVEAMAYSTAGTMGTFGAGITATNGNDWLLVRTPRETSLPDFGELMDRVYGPLRGGSVGGLSREQIMMYGGYPPLLPYPINIPQEDQWPPEASNIPDGQSLTLFQIREALRTMNVESQNQPYQQGVLSEVFMASAQSIRESADTFRTTFEQEAPALADSGTTFGERAASGLMQVAPLVGQEIGTAAAAALRGLALDVNVPTSGGPTVDTGSSDGPQ